MEVWACSLEGHHSTRYARCLFGDLVKSTTITKTALDFTDYIVTFDPPTHEKINHASNALSDTKICLSFFKAVLTEIPPFFRRCGKAKKSYRTLYHQWQEGKGIEKKEVLKASILTASVCSKTLSFLGNVIFKPLKMIDKRADIGGTTRTVAETWEVLGILKSGTKIYYISGKLVLGTKKPFYKTTELIIEIWDVTLSILQLNNIGHPAANLSFAVVKSIFHLYEIYVKTP